MRLISVITVVYNGETEIEQTINSVLKQTYKDIEFIIIDGGSTDATFQIIKKFREDISIIVSEPDKGIYDAMNKAIELAHGEWLYFLNCGDYFIDNSVLYKISLDLQTAFNNMFVYQVNVVDETKKIIETFPRATKFLAFRGLFYARFCHQAIVARRHDYLKVGKFDLEFKVYSDFYTIAKILKSGVRLISQSRIITVYNNYGVSNNWKKVISLSRERETILALLDEDFSYVRYIAVVLKSYFYCLRKSLQSND